MANRLTQHHYENLHGRRVECIFDIQGNWVGCPDGGRMVLHREYLGDREESWILSIDRYGNETARHNCKHLSAISWEPKQA